MRAYGILFFCALGWFFLQSSHVAGVDVRSSFVSLMDTAKSETQQTNTTNEGRASKKKDGELTGEDLEKELRRECEQRKKQNETDAATINKLNEEIKRLKAENKKLNQQVTALESSKDDDANSSDSSLEEENESLRDNINTLREQLAEKEELLKQCKVDDKKKPEEETTSAGVDTRWQTLLLGGGVLLVVLLLLLQGAKIRKLAKPMVGTAEGGAPQLTKKEQQKVVQEQVEAIQKLLADWEARFQETLVHFSQQQEKRHAEERNIPVTEHRAPVVEAKQKPVESSSQQQKAKASVTEHRPPVVETSPQQAKPKVAYGHFLFAEGLRSDNSFDRVDSNRNDYKKFVLKLRAKGDTRAAFALNEQSNQKTQWIAQPSQYLFNEACELVGRLPEVRSQIEIVEEGEAILENGKWYVIKKLSFRLV